MGLLKLDGMIPDALTAFRPDYSLDEGTWREYLRWLIQFPEIHVVGIAGGTGEGASLTFAEFKRCVEIAVDVCQPRVEVVPNIHGESYEKVVEKVEAAQNAGVHCVRIIHPYYVLYEPASLYDYYCDIAQAFPDLSITLYPNLTWTGRPFPVDILAELSDVDNIIGAKIPGTMTYPDLFKLDRLTKGKNFMLMPGLLAHFYDFCRAGIQCAASIDGPATSVAPEIAQSFFRACQAGNWNEALGGLGLLNDLKDVHALGGGISHNHPAPSKCALQLLGRSLGPARRPCRMPTAAEAERIRSKLVKIGILRLLEPVPAAV